MFLLFTFLSISLEPKITNLLSSPPTYKNQKLEQKINENKNESSLRLDCSKLIDDDMEIVGYYALRNNKVNNVFFDFDRQREEKNSDIPYFSCETVALCYSTNTKIFLNCISIIILITKIISIEISVTLNKSKTLETAWMYFFVRVYRVTSKLHSKKDIS